MPEQRWGVIADDVTGACDVAAELRELGLEVAVMLGVPDPPDVPADVDIVVVGLRTRTAARQLAVSESVAAARSLRRGGTGQIYQKYCSTFDSTDEGMIGPVAEALVAEGGLGGSVGTPATPHADRTVYRGHLFVGDRLLSESSLARHPLTPMTDPDLVRVLGRQTTKPVRLVDLRALRAGMLREALDEDGGHVLVDALDDADLDLIASAIDGLPVLPGGGAGLMTAIGRRLSGGRAAHAPSGLEPVDGPGMVIAGSASARTRAQLQHIGGPTVVIDALRAARHPAVAVGSAIAAVRADLAQGRLPAISAGHDPAAIAVAQHELGVAGSAGAVESCLAAIAREAVTELGVRRIIVAGGETSGAVTRELGIRSLRLTRRADPGVAWAVCTATAVAGQPEVGILLKSGNFGAVDLFHRAWTVAP